MKSLIRKGVILAGGKGTRLYPLTKAISKQLMPIYDKPMIYYPLSTLMLAGIKEILVICSPIDLDAYKRLLGNGKQWGIEINYSCQNEPEGIAQALIIAAEFIGDSPICLILGDNLFYGDDLTLKLTSANNSETSTLFAYQVSEPSRYGIVSFDKENNAINIQEKPAKPKSNFAVTGIYFYENNVLEIAKTLTPSERGELEITDINKILLKKGKLKVEALKRGMAWFDTGTIDSLQEAGSFIQTLEKRQGLKIGCPEEISWRLGYISNEQLKSLAMSFGKTNYGYYLKNLLLN